MKNAQEEEKIKNRRGAVTFLCEISFMFYLLIPLFIMVCNL